MDAEVFAEWLRRQGYRVLRTQSSYWVEAGPKVYQAFPYHWLINPSEAELHDLLTAHRAIAVRYSTDLSSEQGKVSYHVVCEDASYCLQSLPRQARQNVRKGLAYADVEPISFSRLAEEGWPLRADTLARQGRVDAESRDWWQRLCQSAADLPGFEAWAAIHQGQLLASFVSFTCDDAFTLPYEQSSSAGLEHRVNNAIFYAVTQQALERLGVSEVFFCLQSLDAPPSIDEFKFRMGYAARPVRQCVVFHPALAPLVNRFSHRAVRQAIRWRSSSSLQKVEGMVRFHLEGKLPAALQQWPDCLVAHRSQLLGASQAGDLLSD